MDISSLQFTPYLVPILGAAIGLTVLAVNAWRLGRSDSGTRAFAILTILSAWWCFTYTLELAGSDPASVLLWVKLEWISIALLPVAWLVFALFYSGRGHLVTSRLVVALCIVPAIVILLAWTTPAHSLIYANPGVTDVGDFVAFTAERGPAFYLNVLYGYALFAVATVLIIRVWREATGSQRQLALVVVLGALLPFIGNAVYQIALLTGNPIFVDLTVPAFAFSALLFAWGWFRLRLYDLMPELGAPHAGIAELGPIVSARTAQERSLNLISLGLSLALFLTLAPLLTILLRRGALSVALAYLAVFLVLLVVAARRTGAYLPRAIALTGIYLALAVLDRTIGSWSPLSGMYLFAFAASAAMLLPIRLAAVALAAAAPVMFLLQPATAPVLGSDIYADLYRLASVLMTAGVLFIALVANRRDHRVLLELSQKLAQELAVEQRKLEQRVDERTRALETSAAVSLRLSTILEQPRLVREVVEQLRNAFAYYHVHIYLWDESDGVLRLVGGTGEAGQSMMVMGHALSPEQGLVGRAYTTRGPVVAPDVSLQPDWLPNQLLPGTKAEIAVPIIYGEDVLGVLDTQDDEVNGLGQEDAQLLQTIAGQLAVALRNARLVAQIQKEADQEVVINTISRKIAQTTDIRQAMQVALVELSRALEPQEATIRLESDSGNGHDH